MNGYNVTHVILGNGESKRVLLTPKVKSVETVKGNEIGVGAIVEVSSDSGAWFAATVVKVVRKDKFLVEYHGLLADDDSQLREEIDVLHIRPHPPDADVDGQFSLLDELDAFYNDGWWVVYFRSSNEELEFEHSQLRLHQDWIGGKWVMPCKVWIFTATLFIVHVEIKVLNRTLLRCSIVEQPQAATVGCHGSRLV
ncbi:DUF724 domain-containing protein 6 [Glycine soja]